MLKRAGLADVYLQGLLGKRGAALVAGGHDRTVVDLKENTPYFQVRKTDVFSKHHLLNLLNCTFYALIYFDHPFGEASFFALIFDRLHHVGKAGVGGSGGATDSF